MQPTLLFEEVDFDLIECSILREAKEVQYYIKGPFLETNIKNKNDRIYPSPVVKPQIEKYQEVIKNGRSAGELNHPNSLEINPERISHRTTKLEFDGKNIVLGEALLGKTGQGAIARGLVDLGLKLGISSRGAGTLKDGVVQKDFRYVCNDIVWEPSAPNAFVEGVLETNSEWVVEGGILVEKDLSDLKLKLLNFKRTDINKVLISLFEQALDKAGQNAAKVRRS